VEQKEISKLHRDLLLSRNERIVEAAQFLSERKAQMQETINAVAVEMGLGIKEEWRLSNDMRFFEKREIPEKEVGP
jgi:hypothetical protein